MKSIKDFTGVSQSGIHDAVLNALKIAGNPLHFDVVEILDSLDNSANRQYKVTIKNKAE